MSTPGGSTPAISPLRRVLFIAIALLLVALVGGAALLVTELWLRNDRANSFYSEVRRYPPHPFLQAVPAMAADHVNAQGFRGESIQKDKPAGTFRIFTIGGSTTLGVNNPYEESYPYLLQQALRERYPGVRIEVQNAGCAWYTSAHALVSYTLEVRQYQPDLVIFFEAVNVLVRSFSPSWLATGPFKPDYSHYLGPYARMLGPESAYFDSSGGLLTWQMLRKWIRRDPDPLRTGDRENIARMAARLSETDRPSFRSLPSYRRYYEGVVHAVRADGTALMVASQPSLFRPDLSADDRRLLWFAPLLCAENGVCPSLAAMIRGMDAYNGASRDIAAARGVPYLDFAGAVPKTTEFFIDDVHMRKAGNALIAAKAAEAIVASGMVEAAVAGVRTGAPRQ